LPGIDLTCNKKYSRGVGVGISVKRVVKNLLGAFGYEIRRKGATRTNLADVLSYLAQLGLRPRTVIDVGAASGTFELYETFPDATHLVIEPLAEFEECLREISKKYRMKVVIAAASDITGTTNINVHDVLTGSSLLREEEGAHVDGVQRKVKAVTIDSLCEENGLKAPFIIKIDVQGGEVMVLNGAKETMKDAEMIILEVQLFTFFKDGPEFYDVINFMKNKGFCVYDIVGHCYRPLDNALSSVDVAFVKEDGQLRKSHHWSTPEQRESITKSLS
jgi:FkbM family methyltransferase